MRTCPFFSHHLENCLFALNSLAAFTLDINMRPVSGNCPHTHCKPASDRNVVRDTLNSVILVVVGPLLMFQLHASVLDKWLYKWPEPKSEKSADVAKCKRAVFWLTDDPICLSGSRWSDINARCKRSLSVLFRPRRPLLNCQSALNCLSVLSQPQRSFPCLLCSWCLKSRSGAYGQHVACQNKWYSRRA